MAEDAEALDGQTTGSEHRMEAIAERARVAEEREARRQAKLEAKAAKEAAALPPIVAEEEDEADRAKTMLNDHDWLVE